MSSVTLAPDVHPLPQPLKRGQWELDRVEFGVYYQGASCYWVTPQAVPMDTGMLQVPPVKGGHFPTGKVKG